MSVSARLSLEDRVGQLFWIGFQGTSLGPSLKSLLERIRPGGLILFSRNIENVPQVRALTDDLFRTLPIPPFIALDQEGGRVNRLKPILGPIPSNLDLAGRADPVAAVDRHARATASALRRLGFSVNFAPVLDLSGGDASNGIGDRAYGKDPRTVCRLAKVFLEAHLKAGVVPVGKHFPGLGSARADTHLILPAISRSYALLWKEDLLPYRRLRQRLPVVMAGHGYYPAVQGGSPSPATLSKAVVDGLLRREVGYTGVILTDDLEMGALDRRQGAGPRALAALAAGNDGLMFCGSETKIMEAYETVLAALRRKEVDAARVVRSVRRLQRLKERFLLRRRRAPCSAEIVERSRRLLASLGAGADSGHDPTTRL